MTVVVDRTVVDGRIVVVAEQWWLAEQCLMMTDGGEDTAFGQMYNNIASMF